jgi:hypothetical protein
MSTEQINQMGTEWPACMRMYQWLAGLLAGWLAGWLVGWLGCAGWLTLGQPMGITPGVTSRHGPRQLPESLATIAVA